MCSPLTRCLTPATYIWISIALGCADNGDPKDPPTSEVQPAAVDDAAAAENGPWVPIPVTVGKATTRSVVASSVCVMISDYFLTKLLIIM